MATLSEIRSRFQSLQGKEIGFAADAINDNAEIAADLVAKQLSEGVKSDGTAADFTYTPMTIAIKKTKQGLAGVTDHLTNYDTGESYKGLYLKVKGSDIEQGTTSSKEDAISERMDGKAFGLTPDSKTELIREYVQPDFITKIRAFLHL